VVGGDDLGVGSRVSRPVHPKRAMSLQSDRDNTPTVREKAALKGTVGTPGAAVRFLHRLMLGEVLPRALLSSMTECFAIGGALADRPWKTTGYGLGLVIGNMLGACLGIGHSGAPE
jgi:hypothetical protein